MNATVTFWQYLPDGNLGVHWAHHNSGRRTYHRDLAEYYEAPR